MTKRANETGPGPAASPVSGAAPAGAEVERIATEGTFVGKWKPRQAPRSNADVIYDARGLIEAIGEGKPYVVHPLDIDLINELADRLEKAGEPPATGARPSLPPAAAGHQITLGVVHVGDEAMICLRCSCGHRECLDYSPTLASVVAASQAHRGNN